MDTSQQVGAKRKKKNRPAQKGACPVSTDSSQTKKSSPGSAEAKTQLGQQPAVVKKSCPLQEQRSSSVQQPAKVVLTQVPVQPEKQAQEVQPGESGQKKKKKKKKKPKQPPSEQQVTTTPGPGRPSQQPESGCCKLRNLKEITCLELICPHSSKPAAKAFSAGESNAAPPPKCPQPEVATTNALTPNHLESLSDAIVKSLASLDKTSISITLVNPDSAASEKVVHALHEPNPNSQIVIDICGSSVTDRDKGMTGKVLQNSSGGAVSSGDGARAASKKSKGGGGGTKVANNHAPSSAEGSLQKGDGKAPKAIQKQAKPGASQASEPSLEQPNKEKGSTANKPDASAPSGAAPGIPGEKTKAQLKAERKAAFEAENAARLAAQKAEGAAEKSKAELKAQRRALQDSQRAAKAQVPASDKPSKPAEAGTAPAQPPSKKAEKEGGGRQEQPHVQTQEARKSSAPKKAPPRQHEVLRLFSHLHQCPGTVDHLKSYGLSGSQIHPVVFQTGLQIAESVIVGSNARCIAMLLAFSSLIDDYTCDASKRISQDLREQLDKNTEFLNKCRPLSMSMQNAVTFLKGHISEIQDTQSPQEVKGNLVDWVNNFIHDEIGLAKKQITVEAQQKIMDEDVILTYCCSSLVKSVLKLAFESGKKFRVIIVDSRPQFRGRDMLNYLSSVGINCTYVLITAVSYIMKEVTKVLLGASSLLANGYVMGHIGASQIALVAKSRNVPVLVCCETYKFSERVITDSFALNELGPTAQLVSSLPPGIRKDGLKDLPSLSFLNLMYDVTAPQFVDMVITEKGILPCTSVPVVLRMRNAAGQ